MSSGTNIKYSTYNFFKGIAEYFTPVLTKSHFQEKGVLTPEEFVNAGDLLVEKCPTWAWYVIDFYRITIISSFIN